MHECNTGLLTVTAGHHMHKKLITEGRQQRGPLVEAQQQTCHLLQRYDYYWLEGF